MRLKATDSVKIIKKENDHFDHKDKRGIQPDAAMEGVGTLPNAEIENVLLKLAEPLLVSFECFDVFNDPADRKSVAYRFQYRAADRTLKAEEVDAAHAKVLDALVAKAGVKFR